MVGVVVEEEAPGPQGTLSTAARSERTTAAWTTGEVVRAVAEVTRVFGDYTHDDNNNPVVVCPKCDKNKKLENKELENKELENKELKNKELKNKELENNGRVTLRVLATTAQALMKRRRALDAEAEMKLAYYVDDGAVGHDAQGRGRQAGVVSAAEATTVVRCNRGCTLEFALWPVGMAVDGVAANLGPSSEVSTAQAGTLAAVDRTLVGAGGTSNVDDLRSLGDTEEVTTTTTVAVWGGPTGSGGGGNELKAALVSDGELGLANSAEIASLSAFGPRWFSGCDGGGLNGVGGRWCW
ncbi:hypothetical protein HK405_014132 [Cladochytrium tenue]|nr:hypothetical protein HK405_014132 [Cladochytrium tenue]